MSLPAAPNFFSTHRTPIAAVALLLLVGGFFAYDKLQTALFPEITFPKIKIIADAGQQPVDKMMLTVTRPLELAIKQVPDLKTIRSTTSRGSCEISAFLSWQADVNLSQQRIESKIAAIRNALPPDLQITVERMNPSILPVIGYTIRSHDRSPIELKKLATFTIKPFLSQVDGVAEIRVIGGKEKEFWLALDLEKMASLGLAPEAVSTALGQTNFVTSNGYLSDYRLLYLTVTDATLDNKAQLENLVIKDDGRRIILLKDICAVEIREAKEYIKINANGADGLLIAVVKQPNSNLIALSDEMAAKLGELKKALPSDVQIEPFYVQADFVRDSIRSVTDSLFLGLGLAILVAILFLRSVKASATILLSIPITLGLTMIGLWASGQTLNIMTLGAIAAAIGLVIDDAIVVVEQIHRTREERPDLAVAVAVRQAVGYLFPAMVGSSLSTIVIFLPFALMTGVAGAYFNVMTATMILALVSSFLVTWLVLPVLFLLLNFEGRRQKAKGKSQKEDSEAAAEKSPKAVKKGFFARLFGKKKAKAAIPHSALAIPHSPRWVLFFVKKPLISLVFMAGLAASIAWVFPKLETGFLPEMDEGSIVFDYNSPPGTSLEETDRMLREVEKILVKIPEIASYSRRTGTQMGFFITEPNRGDYLISLKKSRERTTEDVISDIRARVEATQPALTIDFGQVIGDMLGDLMASVQPIEIKIFGNDVPKLQELAQKTASIIEKTKGAADVFDGIVIAGPSVSIVPNASKLAQFGLTPAGLQAQIQQSLEGQVVGQIQESQQMTPIRMVFPGNLGRSVEQLRQLRIFLPSGKLKSIGDLADIKIEAGEAEIERENLQSMGVVTARLEGRDLGSVMREVQKAVSQKVALPSGFHIEYGGEFAEQQRSFRELLTILLVASLLVFGVMLFLFQDLRVAFAILTISVLGVAGSYLALFFTKTPLNVGSYTGLIMIVGIIGENAIFTFLQFRDALRTRSADEAAAFAIGTRLRPKLMTALGAIIALAPIALGIGAGAQLHQPLAIAVIGGFLAALPLLLIVLPTWLRWIFRNLRFSE